MVGVGILPFLVQWLTLSGLGNREYNNHIQSGGYGSNMGMPPKSHWTLLAEFQSLPEDEIERFLPQVCNIILEREIKDDYGIYDQFERMLVAKCAGCMTFGMRVCGLLKAASPPPSEGLFKNVLTNNAAQVARDERLRYLHEHCEAATLHGDNLPERMNHLRSTYFRDVNFMLDTLARLGSELKTFPLAQRNHHLQNAVGNMNNWLFNRMLGKGLVDSNHDHVVTSDFQSSVTPMMVAQNCPQAAAYSVHLPLQHCSDKVLRLLRFVENECEVLPSKERAPYLLVAEMVEQPFTCKSEELFAQGHPIGLTIEDVINGRTMRNYRLFLQPPTAARAIAASTTGGSIQGVDIDSLLNSGLDLDNLGFSPSSFAVDFSTPSRPNPVPTSAAVFPSSPVDDRSPGSSLGMSAESKARSLLERVAQAHGSELGQGGETEIDLDDQFDVYHTAKTEHVRVFARNDIPLDDVPLKDLRGGHVSMGNNDRDYNPYQPYNQPQPFQTQTPQGGYLSPGDSYYNTGLPQEATTATGAASYEWNPNQPSPTNNLNRDIHSSHDIYGSSNHGYSQGLQQQHQQYSQDNNNLDYYSRSTNQPPPPTTTSGDTPFQNNPYAQPNYGFSTYDPASGSTGYDMNMGGMNSIDTMHGMQGPYAAGQRLPVGQGNMMGMGMQKTFVKGKTWEEKKAMIQSTSAFGHLPGWTVKSFIVKAGDDLRKELLAMQLINLCQEVFQGEGLDIALRPYQIVSTGQQAGLVEFVEGARSIDRIKKSSPDVPTLKEYFDFSYGASYSVAHSKAVQNFVKSLAGYSLVTYLLQVRDRHNANLLLDNDGHLIHIDYGFIFGDSPGFNMNFENAPFKLTREYLEVMGGVDSQAFKMFEDLFVRGFFALQKQVDSICAIVQLFYGDRRKQAADGLRSRLMFASSQADVLSLVRDSFDNWRTKQYDWFQQRSNNILM